MSILRFANSSEKSWSIRNNSYTYLKSMFNFNFFICENISIYALLHTKIRSGGESIISFGEIIL